MADPLVINDRLSIPAAELRFSFARSSGPGGQNVNKVSTKAVLHWAVRESPSVPPSVRERFLARFAGRITAAGEIVIASDRHRHRSRNTRDCLERLRAMLLSVATPPRRRRRTAPPRAAKETRLQDKRRRAQKKQNRRPPRDLD